MPTDIRSTGKSRSQRINIDYYRQKTWLGRSRGMLALLAAVLALGYCVLVFGSGGSSHVSTGPVASVHASFENDCQQCHSDFTPISADAMAFASDRALDRLEDACQKCHRVDHHFRSEMTSEFAAIDQHCAGCHHDHQGRDHDMLNIASEQCTQCHGNLKATCTSPDSIRVNPNVAKFTAESHGDFASLKKGDPGRIKFDHAQHMMPGQVEAGFKGGFTLAMLEPELRDGYRKSINGVLQADDAVVTLSCADCHQFAGTTGLAQAGDDEIGRHIAPISFDQHCAACHSLNAIGRVEDTLPLPHAAPWKEVETLIASKLVGGQQIGSIRMPRDVVRKTPLVGEGLTGALESVSQTPENAEAKAILDSSVRATLASVAERCLQCHDQADITDESITSLRNSNSPPLIPSRWLTRGIYDHAAHRKVDCKYCHAEAYSPPPPSDSQSVDETAIAAKQDDSEIVMIGGIETCTGCHRDAAFSIPNSFADEATQQLLGGQGNWASDACTECHRYHWQPPPTSSPEGTVSPVALKKGNSP